VRAGDAGDGDGGGRGRDGAIEVRSPWDRRLLGAVPAQSAAEVDAAVSAALDCRRGPDLPAHERAAILDRAAVALTEGAERFARSIASEAAKPVRAARAEVARAADTLRFSAAVARTLGGEVVPLDASAAGAGRIGLVLRVPIGVVAAISPFNFPLNLVCHKVGPALAAGCPVVLKPAPATPLTALLLATTLAEAGLPTGWLNVVTCTNDVAGALVDHPGVALISFTGSAAVGWDIRSRAPRKRVNLELGNNSTVIVEPDGDAGLESTAAKVAAGGYAFAGQTCISVQRVLVHHSVRDRFVEALVACVADLVVGDPLDEDTDLSVLISPTATERVLRWIGEAEGAGARVAAGGRLDGDGVLLPCVLTHVTPDMRVCHDEVFGPVVGVQAYDDFDEAVDLANDTRFGLQVGVFTRDLARALDAARRLAFGGVLINEVPTWRADQMPYGGVRDSGNTREGPRYAAEEMTESRLVVLAP